MLDPVTIIIILAIALALLLWRQFSLAGKLAHLTRQAERLPGALPGSIDPSDIARKEEMLQVATSAVHNIGNAVTVAKLSIHDLMESTADTEHDVLELILSEILPELERRQTAGGLDAFLRENPEGKEYFSSIRQLLEHLQQQRMKQRRTVVALDRKLSHIGEIIELQQRLSSGLGSREMVRIEKILDDAVLMISESLTRHNVTLQTDYAETKEINVDCLILTQLFINLLRNAIQAMNEIDGPEKNIHVITRMETREGISCVTAEIVDNGPGIPEELQENIFNFGFTTKTGGSGSGVGLHFCRRAVERYGGWIDLQSQPGKGAAFIISIPVGPSAATQNGVSSR